MRKGRLVLVSFLIVLAALQVSAADKRTLRVAFGSVGDNIMQSYDELKAAFEKANPGVTVEMVIQPNDVYDKMGLPTLLNSDKSPDVYAEWGGNRVLMRYTEGFAADLAPLMAASKIRDRFTSSAWDGCVIDGKTVMFPLNVDISNVYWYNVGQFRKAGITSAPKSWDEFLGACAKLKSAGFSPLVSPNKDLWAGGNWIAHLVSRVVGEKAYNDALRMKRPFSGSDFEKAFGYVRVLWDSGYVNRDVNGIGDEEGEIVFTTARASMFPIGNWVAGSIAENTKGTSFEFACFNLPAMPGGKGDQTSLVGVKTGYVINKRSRNIDLGFKFLQMHTSDQFLHRFDQNLIKGNLEKGETEPHQYAVNELLGTTKTIVSPPDTGYDLEVADGFYTAIAQVLGGAAEPKAALAELDAKLAQKRTN